MTSWLRAFFACVLALSVLVILVSPCAASPLTTMRSPQKVRPPMAVAVLAIDLNLANWSAFSLHGLAEGPAPVASPGSEVVALTCAWLC